MVGVPVRVGVFVGPPGVEVMVNVAVFVLDCELFPVGVGETLLLHEKMNAGTTAERMTSKIFFPSFMDIPPLI
jgi:hypothetical protein